MSLRIASPAICARIHGSSFQILMVKRSSLGSLKNLSVFPGGAVDAADDCLNFSVENTKINSLKIKAIRETFEETGLQLFAPTLRNVDSWRESIHA